jgi:hypothetical protein
MFYVLTTVLLLTDGSTQHASADFLCKTDVSVGYKFDENTRSWTSANFLPKGDFVIRQLTDTERQQTSEVIYPKGSTWGVFTPDRPNFPRYGCPEPRTSLHESGLHCGGGGDEFDFDSRSLRYQTYYRGGYVYGRDNNDDTPAIDIGRCKILN